MPQTVASTRIKKARKTHRCDTCEEVIPRGASYTRSVVSDGGEVHTWKSCEACNAWIEKKKKERSWEHGEA